MSPELYTFDHIVLTCEDISKSRSFYQDVLGMTLSDLADGRIEAHFGSNKINLQPATNHYGPSSNVGRRWSGNFCILSTKPIAKIVGDLTRQGVPIIEGPVRKLGACGELMSVYIHDPDRNLIEISNEITEDP